MNDEKRVVTGAAPNLNVEHRRKIMRAINALPGRDIVDETPDSKTVATYVRMADLLQSASLGAFDAAVDAAMPSVHARPALCDSIRQAISIARHQAVNEGFGGMAWDDVLSRFEYALTQQPAPASDYVHPTVAQAEAFRKAAAKRLTNFVAWRNGLQPSGKWGAVPYGFEPFRNDGKEPDWEGYAAAEAMQRIDEDVAATAAPFDLAKWITTDALARNGLKSPAVQAGTMVHTMFNALSTIINFSDLEMRDGDGARQVAQEALDSLGFTRKGGA
jgi:hypothetical protein